MTAWNALAERARGEGMGGLVDLAEHWDEAGTRLAQAFRSRWFETLLEGVYAERPALGAFEGRGHEIEVALFGALDGQVLRHARDLIVQGTDRLAPPRGPASLRILRARIREEGPPSSGFLPAHGPAPARPSRRSSRSS
ncbi:MAG: hypothetical protein U0794_23020 [Isosphaeraceae bacterium]